MSHSVTLSPRPRDPLAAVFKAMSYGPQVDRAALKRDSAVKQMAEDFRERGAQSGCVTEDDLAAMGWTDAQIAAHGRNARQRAIKLASSARAERAVKAAKAHYVAPLPPLKEKAFAALFQHRLLVSGTTGPYHPMRGEQQTFSRKTLLGLATLGFAAPCPAPGGKGNAMAITAAGLARGVDLANARSARAADGSRQSHRLR